MLQQFAERLGCAEDKFQFVVECDLLHRTNTTYSETARVFREFVSRLDSREDRALVLLGLLYVEGRWTERTGSQLLLDLESIRSVHAGSVTKATFSLVRSAILITHCREFKTAQDHLLQLYESLRHSDDHFLCGLVAKTVADASMFLGEHAHSEEFFQEAVGIFQRYRHNIPLAYTLNNFAILKKKMCDYDQAERLAIKAQSLFERLRLMSGELSAMANLGILAMRAGDFSLAHRRFTRALEIRASLSSGKAIGAENVNSWCDTLLEHLCLQRREFGPAYEGLRVLEEKYRELPEARRHAALVHEFLGEWFIETGDFKQARDQLDRAYQVTEKILPDSDVMTEVLRRQADLHSRTRNYDSSKQTAIRCIRLCNKIGDKYELGAVVRILGQAWYATGEKAKAKACFETAINTLKSIHDRYELMRSYLVYGRFLVDEKLEDADVYLIQAHELCRHLKLDFFSAQIDVELSKLAVNNSNFRQARECLSRAEKTCDGLQDCDQKQVQPLIDRVAKALDKKIFQTSLSAAEELKTICRIYEDARFPMDELKPDMAYQVAKSVDAEALFLVRRRGKGYAVHLTYNIPINDAKEIVRRLDRDQGVPLLGVEKDPRIFNLYTGKQLVCVPSYGKSHVLCALISEERDFTPRHFEFLFASTEALERLALDSREEAPVVHDHFLDDGEGRAPTHPRGPFNAILTVDPQMIKTIRLAERASQSDVPILLEGDTGVGKELFARAIHDSSERKDGPFVAINAGGMPVSFIESQLFGHVKGAYTDAVVDRIGLIEEACGGSVFLDEIGEMGVELQVKLLRLLENGEYRRLGENDVRHANVRVISATNRDLLRQVEGGHFRRDLYYRLGTVKLAIPALRFRPRDIELLVRHFLKVASTKSRHGERYFEIDVKTMEAFELYNWPGNVRELHNEIARMVSLIGENDVIRFGMVSDAIKDFLRTKNKGTGLLDKSVQRYERRLILDALSRNDWNRMRTAEQVGMPRTTLLAKMKRLDISPR